MSTIPPLQEGLFENDAAGVPRLLANRCAACDRVFFPRRSYCGQCGGADLQPLQLAGRGRVYSHSLIDRKQKIAVIEPPYVQAEIAMPEGVHVFTVLDQVKPGAVQVGMDVEMYVGEVNSPAGEGKVRAYKFKPAQGGSA